VIDALRVLDRIARKSLEVPCLTKGLMPYCWVWQGYTCEGYGRIGFKRPDGTWRTMLNHRAAYQTLVGPIPVGADIDHLCRVRACWNPWHLDPVTRTVNIKRGLGPQTAANMQRAKTHCPQGHPYDETNTARRGRRRHCRTCERDRARRNRERS
jgi:hypothetical protein